MMAGTLEVEKPATGNICSGCVGSLPGSVWWESSQARLLRCSKCGLIFLDSNCALARQTVAYDRTYYERYYFRHRAVRERFFAQWAQRLSELHPPGRLLDVGCGAGFFLTAAKQLGWQVAGVEPSAGAAAVRDPTIEVHVGGLESLNDRTPSFDLITFWDVLAHVDDPFATLQSATRLLARGGLVLIKTPNRSTSFQRFGRLLRFIRGTRAWFHLPAQRSHFNRTSLEAMLVRAGLQVVSTFEIDEPVHPRVREVLAAPKVSLFVLLNALLRISGWRESLIVIAKSGAV